MTDKPEPKHEKRHIVICCDGTGNEITENISNVLKLYRTLRKTEKTHPNQLVFYDPGVGTLERPRIRGRSCGRICTPVFGLATGYGLDDNILGAYRVHRRQLSRGRPTSTCSAFRRGAYTVRALAGLIHKVGLIATAAEQSRGLGARPPTSSSARAPPGLPASYDGARRCQPKEDQAAQYARILSVKWPTIKFVGVWDTVASVIVPRPGPALSCSFSRGADAWPIVRHNPSDRDLPPGDLDRRAAPHVPAATLGRRQPIPAAPLRPGSHVDRTQDSCRSGSPACIPTSAAAIRKQQSGAVEISAAVDDRGGGASTASRSTAAPSTSSAGAASARTARSTMSRPASCPTPQSGLRRLAAAQFDERRPGALLEYYSEEGQVQGMAGAQIGARLLHPVTPSRG